MHKYLLAAAALMMAQPALASDPAELSCMAETYTPEQTAQIDALLPKLKIERGGEDPAGGQLAEVIFAASTQCGEKLGWNENQILPAILFELGRYMETSFVKFGPMSAEDIAKLEATLAKGDRTALWEALEGEVKAGMTGQPSGAAPGNAMLYGQFMLEAGFGFDTTKAEQIGIFLGTKAMQRFSRREFGAKK